MKPPPYIPLIQNGWIRVQGDTKRIDGLQKMLTSIPFGYTGVQFAEGGGYFENKDLILKLNDLNKKGVAFGEDYKQAYCPASFMRELQLRGDVKTPFKSIYWTGRNEWHLRENLPDEAGNPS